MPLSTRGKSTSLPVEDIIEAFLDDRVKESLKDILKDSIRDIVNQCLEARLKPLQDSFQDLKKTVNLMEKKTTDVEGENSILRRRVDELEAYSRRDNLMIHGLKVSSYADAASVTTSSSQSSTAQSSGSSSDPGGASAMPVESNAETERAVIDFCTRELGVSLSLDDISIAHRLPASRNGPHPGHPAPVIVKFTNSRTRNNVYKARKILGRNKTGIFINEHLIQRRANVFKEARRLVKIKKLEGAWTVNGVVFIKLSNLPDSRPIRVEEIRDLPSG